MASQHEAKSRKLGAEGAASASARAAGAP